MKAQMYLTTITAVAAIALLSGCGKSADNGNDSEPGSEGTVEQKTVTESVTESVKEAAKPVVEEATKAVEAAKPAVEEAANEVKESASSLVSEATAKANNLISQAKSLIDEAKYSDAMNIVNQLKDMKLTPEQEKLVADMKTQIDKAISAISGTNASGALNNLLKK